MRISLTLGLVALLTTPVLAPGSAQTSQSQVTVNLAPVHGSSQRGTALLTQRGNALIVAVHVITPQGPKMKANGGPMMMQTGPLAADIDRGSCPNPQRPLYPLKPVTSGTSTTTLTGTNLSKLTTGSYTISVRQSASDPKEPIACGDIKLANPTGTSQ